MSDQSNKQISALNKLISLPREIDLIPLDMLRMGIETKTTVKILSGLLGAIGLVILSASVNSWVTSETKKNEKIDKVYDYILINSKNDSLQDARLQNLELKLDKHQLEIEAAITGIYKSMYDAQKQLTEKSSHSYLDQN